MKQIKTVLGISALIMAAGWMALPGSSVSAADPSIVSAGPAEAGVLERKETDMKENQIVRAVIGGKTFLIQLEDNKTARAFADKLPLTLTMKELHHNEKYAYHVKLPASEKDVVQIRTGDVMLYGDDCLVLFYQSFPTSYRYTRIGHVIHTDGLSEAVGKNDVSVTFQRDH